MPLNRVTSSTCGISAITHSALTSSGWYEAPSCFEPIRTGEFSSDSPPHSARERQSHLLQSIPIPESHRARLHDANVARHFNVRRSDGRFWRTRLLLPQRSAVANNLYLAFGRFLMSHFGFSIVRSGKSGRVGLVLGGIGLPMSLPASMASGAWASGLDHIFVYVNNFHYLFDAPNLRCLMVARFC